MDKLLNFPSLDDRVNGQIVELLKLLYDERIIKVDFTTAIKQNTDSVTISSWENLLSQVFYKYGFATDSKILTDMFCIDMEGLRNFKALKYDTSRKLSLSEKILDHLTPIEQQEAAKAILRRLQAGIHNEIILENHLALCRELKIYESSEVILSLLLNGHIPPYYMYEAAEIFVYLGGDWSQIVPVFEGFQQYDTTDYLQFISKLKDAYPTLIIKCLIKAITTSESRLERRLDYAQLLMELGSNEGFYFVTELLRRNEPLPLGPSRQFQLQKLDTSLMLAELTSLVPLLFEEEKNDFHVKEPKSLFVELLSSIAEKCESDMLLVDALLESALLSVSPIERSRSNINWYRERILESFRNNGDIPLPLNEITSILMEIE